MNFFEKLSRFKLLIATFISVILGVVLGLVLKRYPDTSSEWKELIGFPGEIFLRGLQLMILPSIIFSLIVGAASLNIKTCGRVAIRTFSYFLFTSLFSTIIGVILGISMKPGNPDILSHLNQQSHNGTIGKRILIRQNTLADNIMDLIRNIVPNNIFSVLFELTQTVYTTGENEIAHKSIEIRKGTNFLGVITISIALGTILSTFQHEAKALTEIFKILDKAFSKLVGIFLWIMPLGVGSIICRKILEVETFIGLVTQLGMFILTVTIGIFLYQLLFMQLFYLILVQKNPFKFYLGVLPSAIAAFALQSSSAALPVTFKCVDENVKIDSRISRFVIPLGVTINMDGTALFVTIASIFIAQIHDFSFNGMDYVTICITATAVSVATATTPSASISILFIILNSIGVPADEVGILFSVDWFLDRLRTTNNVLGDCYTAAIVQHWSQKELQADDMKEVSKNLENEVMDRTSELMIESQL